MKLLVTCGHLQRHISKYEDRIRQRGIDIWVPELKGQQFSSNEMSSMISEVEVVIAGDDALDASVLEAGARGRLRGLVRWGIGTDNVDKFKAAELGLPVFNTPGMFSNEVADLALGHLLNLARHIHKMDSDVRAGKWTRYEGRSLSGLTVGVIGLGGIGCEVARRCTAFGMEVVGYDIAALDPKRLHSMGVHQQSFEEVITTADVLIIACNLTADNKHMLNAEAFAQMKQGVVVINVARGPIIDEISLIDALQSGRVSAAGLDVFEVEPLPLDSPLRNFPNVLFGTHSGSSTAEAIQRTNKLSVDIALALLSSDWGYLKDCNRVA